MTTIVTDGKLLASDSQSSIGDEIYEVDCQKIFPDVGPFKFIAVTGNYQDAMDVISTIKDYTLMDQIRGLDFKELGWESVMLGVTKEGQLWHYTGSRSFELRPELPYAVGSGAPYALGALAMGANAVDAVAVASRYDPYTNDTIQVVEIVEGAASVLEETEEEENTIH